MGGAALPFFGNPAVSPFADRWLCVPASRLVCLYRKGTFYATKTVRDSCQHVSEDPFSALICVPSNFNTLGNNRRTLESDWPISRLFKDDGVAFR